MDGVHPLHDFLQRDERAPTHRRISCLGYLYWLIAHWRLGDLATTREHFLRSGRVGGRRDQQNGKREESASDHPRSLSAELTCKLATRACTMNKSEIWIP